MEPRFALGGSIRTYTSWHGQYHLSAPAIMKKIACFLLVLSLFSCGIKEPLDESLIIGSKPPFPYGGDSFPGWKNCNGKKNLVYAVYYKGKALVYVMDQNNRAAGYFFSRFIDAGKALKTPTGASYEEVIEKFGEPAFVSLWPEDDGDMAKGGQQETCELKYLQRERERFFTCTVSPIVVSFLFNADEKLISVSTYYAGH
jgi:hypothetical protein